VSLPASRLHHDRRCAEVLSARAPRGSAQWGRASMPFPAGAGRGRAHSRASAAPSLGAHRSAGAAFGRGDCLRACLPGSVTAGQAVTACRQGPAEPCRSCAEQATGVASLQRAAQHWTSTRAELHRVERALWQLGQLRALQGAATERRAPGFACRRNAMHPTSTASTWFRRSHRCRAGPSWRLRSHMVPGASLHDAPPCTSPYPTPPSQRTAPEEHLMSKPMHPSTSTSTSTSAPCTHHRHAEGAV
jgi:hypothetical protein